jgi:hypothetical protein
MAFGPAAADGPGRTSFDLPTRKDPPVADLLQTAMAQLDTMRQSYLAQSISYVRDSTVITSVAATPQQQEFATDNMDGTVTVLRMTAWIITVAALSALGTPHRGDKIRQTLDGVTHVYEVLPPGGGPVYEEADPYRQCWKIFTKYVGTM